MTAVKAMFAFGLMFAAEVITQHLDAFKRWEFYTDRRGIRRRRTARAYLDHELEMFKRRMRRVNYVHGKNGSNNADL